MSGFNVGDKVGTERITGVVHTRRKTLIFTRSTTYYIDTRPRWLKVWDRLRRRKIAPSRPP